jgi:hypothetical protein
VLFQGTFVYTANDKANMGTLSRVLREVMIRHANNHRVGGVLAVPTLDCCTVWLDMSTEERTVYNRAEAISKARLDEVKANVVARSTLKSNLSQMIEACGHAYAPSQSGLQVLGGAGGTGFSAFGNNFTKIRALLNDLAELKKTEPSMHCIVFTNLKKGHDMLVHALEPLYQVYHVCSGTQCDDRDRAIRSFQDGWAGGPPAVFVVDMKVIVSME